MTVHVLFFYKYRTEISFSTFSRDFNKSIKLLFTTIYKLCISSKVALLILSKPCKRRKCVRAQFVDIIIEMGNQNKNNNSNNSNNSFRMIANET